MAYFMDTGEESYFVDRGEESVPPPKATVRIAFVLLAVVIIGAVISSMVVIPESYNEERIDERIPAGYQYYSGWHIYTEGGYVSINLEADGLVSFFITDYQNYQKAERGELFSYYRDLSRLRTDDFKDIIPVEDLPNPFFMIVRNEEFTDSVSLEGNLVATDYYISAVTGIELLGLIWIFTGISVLVIIVSNEVYYRNKASKKDEEGLREEIGSRDETHQTLNSPRIEYASLGRRFTAYAIDLFVIGVVVVLIYVPSSFMGILPKLTTEYLLDIGSWSFWEPPFLYFILLDTVFSMIYFTLQEGGTKNATIGKRAMKLKVLDKEGKPITKSSALVRNIMRLYYIPVVGGFFIHLVDALLIFGKRDRQRIGDIIAHTYVMKVPPENIYSDQETQPIRDTEEKEKVMMCPKCNTKFDETDKFCKNCGIEISHN